MWTNQPEESCSTQNRYNFRERVLNIIDTLKSMGPKNVI